MAYSADYPDTIFTVLRAALLCGPQINNMFSDMWSRKLSALPMGRNPYNQLIHETDMGEAMHRCLTLDLPGVYNVCADDALAIRAMFKAAGVKIIRVPAGLLKRVLNLLFVLRLESVSQGWVSLSEYTIYGLSDKFKRAATWQPRYTSEETFNQYLVARKQDERSSLKHIFLTWLYQTPRAVRLGLGSLNALLFLITKSSWLRELMPMTSPARNTMTYLPINKVMGQGGVTVVPIHETIGETGGEVLPSQILHEMIDLCSYHRVMDQCICRSGFDCQNFTHDIGCLFMGETASKLPPGLGRRVSREMAHQHVERAMGVGLVPMIGKVNIDNLGFLTPDTGKLLSVCFCCHCCCMMGYYKHDAAHLKKLFKPVEGLQVILNEKCTGCGACVGTCIFDNIFEQNGRITHGDHCVGCGRCEATCQLGGVTLILDDPEYPQKVIARIKSHVEIS